MKNLILAIMLLAVGTASAFDKVWELQFASTPHHVHYTEGHKELIVGEGNTFKKYDAETGKILDSVSYNFDALKDYTIGEFHITDDLKNMYVVGVYKDSIYASLLLKWKLSDNNLDIIYKQNATEVKSFNYSYVLPGNLNQISNNKYLFSFYASLYAGLPLFSGHSGAMNIVIKDKVVTINQALSSFSNNTYTSSAIMFGDSYYEYKSGMGQYSENQSQTALFLNGKNDSIINISNLFSISNMGIKLSKNDLYIYAKSNDYIYKYNFKNNDNKIINIENKYYNYYSNILLPFNNDDELILKYNRKLFQYNYSLNKIIDSLIVKDSVISYLSNLNYGHLITIDTNRKLIAYKSSIDNNKPFSAIKDTLIYKSVGDSIGMIVFNRINPISDEWDLGDGRKLTGSSVTFTFSKKGEYIAKYKAVYKDTIINLQCRIVILDTLDISIIHKVEFENNKTILTINGNISGDYNVVKINLNSSNSITKIDSNITQVKYIINEGGVIKVNLTVTNDSQTKSMSKILTIPTQNIKNTEFNLLNMDGIAAIIYSNEELLFQKYYFSQDVHYNSQAPQDSYGNYYYYYFLDKLNNDFSMTNIDKHDFALKIGGTYNMYGSFGFQNLFSDKKSGIKLFIKQNGMQNNFSIYDDNSFLNTKTYSCLYHNRTQKLQICKVPIGFFVKAIAPANAYAMDGIYLYYIDTASHSFTQVKDFNNNLYANSVIYSDSLSHSMVSVNKNISIFKLNENIKIIDTLFQHEYTRHYASNINSDYAYFVFDTSKNIKQTTLTKYDINKQKVIQVPLDTTINYYQIYNLNDNVNCLVGNKNNELLILAFNSKDDEMKLTEFKIPVKELYNIIDNTKDNELHLSYTISGTITSYFKTKGFADVVKQVMEFRHDVNPVDTTSNPVDTTKKGIVYKSDNNFGFVTQDPDYKKANVVFKDSVQTANSILKVYTDSGTEILTYNLSKDQKEQNINTEKLYIGTYFVRLLQNGEEHNIGRFIIVK